MGLAFTSATVFVLGNWLLAIPAGMIAGLFLMQVPLMVDPSTRSRLMEMISHRTLRKNGSSDLGFWIIVVISLAGFYGGLVWACFLGIGLSCLVVLRRLSSKLAAQWASLDRYQSRRVRSAGELATLGRLKHRVAVLRLTGHLFFGNSARLTQLMDELHRDTTTVLIDVSQVHDVDPSGLSALEMLIKALTGRQLQVILTGHRRSPSADLREGLQGLHKSVLNNTDLDRGLERAEDSVLLQATLLSAPLTRQEVADNALLQGFDEDELTAVLMLGEQREVSKGQPLFYRGDVADGIWMLQQGTVSILAGGLDSSRLATFGPGQFLGEMGMIDGKTRSATARADTPLLALHLDAQAIDALQEQHGVAALKIMRNIARELSLRVRATSAMMADESSEASVEWANSSLGPMSKF